MCRTAVNITGDAVCTTIVACQDGAVKKAVSYTHLVPLAATIIPALPEETAVPA